MKIDYGHSKVHVGTKMLSNQYVDTFFEVLMHKTLIQPIIIYDVPTC